MLDWFAWLASPSWQSTMVFVLSLPVAVLASAAAFGLYERPIKVNPLLRLVTCFGAVIALLLLTDKSMAPWVGAAFITVWVLHGVRQLVTRLRVLWYRQRVSQPY